MKRYKPVITDNNQLEDVDVNTYCVDRVQPTDNEKLIYLSEVESLCPLCGNSLITKNKKGIRFIGQIAHIFPCNPTPPEKDLLKDVEVAGINSESMENKIALCRNCHDNYDHNKSVQDYENLFRIKRNVEAIYGAKATLATQPIEKKIEDIVKGLSNIEVGSIVKSELNYNTLLVKTKMKSSNSLLIHKVENNVTQYFPYIQELFKTQTTKNGFDAIAFQIKHIYSILKDKGHSEDQIFNDIKDWMKSKTNGNIEACEILTSFFIQDCEIYG